MRTDTHAVVVANHDYGTTEYLTHGTQDECTHAAAVHNERHAHEGRRATVEVMDALALAWVVTIHVRPTMPADWALGSEAQWRIDNWRWARMIVAVGAFDGRRLSKGEAASIAATRYQANSGESLRDVHIVWDRTVFTSIESVRDALVVPLSTYLIHRSGEPLLAEVRAGRDALRLAPPPDEGLHATQ